MLLAALALALAPQVWLVDASGGGDFTDLQSAVDAASPGDRIQVLPGSYTGDVLSTKALSIHGLGGQALLDGVLRFSGAASVELSNLYTDGFELTAIPGAVRLRACKVLGGVQPQLRVEDCPDVLVSEGWFYHVPHIGGGLWPNEGVSVFAEDSSLILIDTEVLSGSSDGWASPGIVTAGSVVLGLHGCRVTAGPDSSGWWPPASASAIEGSPTGTLDVRITGNSTDWLASTLFASKPILHATSVTWSGIAAPTGALTGWVEEIPARPFLDVRRSDPSTWFGDLYGPAGTSGLAFASVVPQVWSDPLVGGSDLYFALAGVVDVQPFVLAGQDVAVSLAYPLPTWAAGYSGLTVGVQAVTFTGSTGMEATTPDWIVFD